MNSFLERNERHVKEQLFFRLIYFKQFTNFPSHQEGILKHGWLFFTRATSTDLVEAPRSEAPKTSTPRSSWPNEAHCGLGELPLQSDRNQFSSQAPEYQLSISPCLPVRGQSKNEVEKIKNIRGYKDKNIASFYIKPLSN